MTGPRYVSTLRSRGQKTKSQGYQVQTTHWPTFLCIAYFWYPRGWEVWSSYLKMVFALQNFTVIVLTQLNSTQVVSIGPLVSQLKSNYRRKYNTMLHTLRHNEKTRTLSQILFHEFRPRDTVDGVLLIPVSLRGEFGLLASRRISTPLIVLLLLHYGRGRCGLIANQRQFDHGKCARLFATSCLFYSTRSLVAKSMLEVMARNREHSNAVAAWYTDFW